MKRLHVHVAVPDLSRSIRFYSTLFGAEPVKVERDYAKWMLEDPRVNFAISARGAQTTGVDHVGVQVETRSELDELARRLKAAGETTLDEEAVRCCYAQSDKTWVRDPAGLRWETFYTFGDATTYGESIDPEPAAAAVHASAYCGTPVVIPQQAQSKPTGCCA